MDLSDLHPQHRFSSPINQPENFPKKKYQKIESINTHIGRLCQSPFFLY
jgi:hypothetical protein